MIAAAWLFLPSLCVAVLTEEKDSVGWAIVNTLAYVVFAWSVLTLMGEMTP